MCGDPFVESSRGGEEPKTKKYLKVGVEKVIELETDMNKNCLPDLSLEMPGFVQLL